MSVLSANKIKFIRSLSQKKYRDEHKLFIAEGEKIVEEALCSGYNVKEVYYEKEIGKDTMERISCLSSPSPVLAVIEKPDFTPDSILHKIAGNNSSGRKPLYLALDGVKDPGNLGTILRTIDSVGLTQVIVSKKSGDVFNPKVVRSTMGAIFRVNIIESENLVNTLKEIKKHKFKVVATSLQTEESIYDIDYKKKVIVIGNEANGVSKEVLEMSDKKVKIPMPGKTESLNAAVATGVILYEYVRQKIN